MKRTLTIPISVAAIFFGATTLTTTFAQTKPPGFMIIEYEVVDADGYKKYLEDSRAVREAIPSGKFLVRGASGRSLSGAPPKTIAIIQFPTVEDAIAFDTSPQYSAIKETRDKSIRWRSFVVEGVKTDVQAFLIGKVEGRIMR